MSRETRPARADRRCQKVLPDGDARSRTRYYCGNPARWDCTNIGALLCADHRHEASCCTEVK